MEIKATLLKPYTNRQRVDFIVMNNHDCGYEIKETELALEAWGYTEEEKAEREKQRQKDELIAQLDELDRKCIRSIRAIQAGTGTEADTAKLAELEAQAVEIRRQLQELNTPQE